MPMSPDDYNALRQLVTPVDMAAVVRAAAAAAASAHLLHLPESAFFLKNSLPSLFLFSLCSQDDNVIGGFEAFDAQVDAD